MNIFAKLNSNGFNNKLEQILENKTFDETVKNLLLSMLYKIENGYKDYTMVKVNVDSKDEFIEKILYTIKEYCTEIEIVTPQTEASKPLEKENTICKIDIDRGSILVYANEQDLLYSIIKMNILQEIYKYNYKHEDNETYYSKAIKEFILESKCTNDIEIIRDFDGWSWNNNIKCGKTMERNLIFQNIIMLQMNLNRSKFYTEDYIQAVNQNYEFEKNIYTMILTLSAENNDEIRQLIYKELEQKSSKLQTMLDRENFLNTTTDAKKQIANEIKQIDELLNDKEKLQQEYINRNSKLENKDKIFSVNRLEKKLKSEREQKLEELKSKNKLLEPLEYIKQKDKLENEYNILKNITDNLEDENLKINMIIQTQKEFLNCYSKQIEDIKNKEELEEVLYQFRYYCLLPVSKDKYIKDFEELKELINKTMNIIIDNCIDKGIITNFSNSISLCHNILKYVFATKIINLKEISIKINKQSEEKQQDTTKYHITVSLFDVKDAEDIHNEIVDNLELLNVKINKKISLFVK